MTLVLDAGAFVAVGRGNRDISALMKRERLAGRAPRTHGGVVGQVWRGGVGGQVPVAALLASVEVVAVGEGLGRRAGVLLGRTGTSDVIDAAVVLLADGDDRILTSDPDDLLALAVASGIHIEIIPV